MAAPSLRTRLRTLFPRSDGRGSEEPDTGRNGLALSLSFLVAIVLWFTFSMQETYTTTIEVPLEIAALPDDQALRQRPPQTARVSVQGQGEALLSLTWSPPRVRLFADGPTVDVAASVSESGLPAGVTVLGAQPRSIRLDLDERVTRDLPIRLRGSVRAAAPFDLLNTPQLTPDTVRITGSRALLESFQSWPTAPFVRNDVRNDLSTPLALSDTLAGLVERSITTTVLTATVGEFTRGEITLDVEVENLPTGIETVRFEPKRVAVEYRVPVGAAYAQVERAGLRAVVDYADIARDSTSGSVRVGIRVPEDIDVRDERASPSRVEYFLVRRAPPPENE